MSDQRVKVPAASTVVVDHLRREIQLGHLAAGHKLPPERQHAEQLGVSRLTLRGAIRVLEGEGLVHVRKGSLGGTTIRDDATDRRSLRRQLRRRADEIRATQQFREAVEPLAADRAARLRSSEQLAQLRTTAQALLGADGLGAFRGADSAFHVQLAQLADCPPLVRAVEDARIAMFDPIDLLPFEPLASRSAEDHDAILQAVAAGSPSDARRAMEAHIRHTSRELEELLAARD